MELDDYQQLADEFAERLADTPIEITDEMLGKIIKVGEHLAAMRAIAATNYALQFFPADSWQARAITTHLEQEGYVNHGRTA